MEMDELRRRLGVILAVEEQEDADWPEMERLTRELQQQIHIDAPEIVHHYLDNADIRARDYTYAARQGEGFAALSSRATTTTERSSALGMCARVLGGRKLFTVVVGVIASYVHNYAISARSFPVRTTQKRTFKPAGRLPG